MNNNDELVKRLREPCQYENCILCQQAADVIEELMRRCEQSAQPTQNNDSNALEVLDCVSRQAAIDAIRKIYDSVGILGEKWAVDKCQMAIKDLPSAQPVITCDGCKFVGTYDTDFPCRNCIRREKDYYAQE